MPDWCFAKVASTIEDERRDGTLTETVILMDAVLHCHMNLLDMAKKGDKADKGTKSSREERRGRER